MISIPNMTDIVLSLYLSQERMENNLQTNTKVEIITGMSWDVKERETIFYQSRSSESIFCCN